jgi:Ca2+-binding EF-hand superfamily protein
MGASLSAQDKLLLASLQPQFDTLHLHPSEVRSLFKLFQAVSRDELLDHLEMGYTEYKTRVFKIFDEDNSGQISFREFVFSLWNYCTLSKATLELFAFDLYDVDSDGLLSLREVQGMLSDLYGPDLHSNAQAH